MSRTEVEQMNQAGITLLQDGNVEEALTTFIKAIEVDESYPYPYCHIGNILAAANQTDEAISWFNKAIELDQEMATAYYGLGSALFNLEDWDEAIRQYECAEQKGLNNSDLYFMMGMAYRNKGDGKEARALAYFQRAVDQNPEDIEAIFQRGLCSAFLDHLNQAKQDFITVISHDEDHADAYFNLGVAYAYEGEIEQALEQLDKAIEIQPNHFLALQAKKQIKGE